MGMLVMAAALAVTHTFAYDADVLPNRARPPWSFREVTNCSAVIQNHSILNTALRKKSKRLLLLMNRPVSVVPYAFRHAR